MRVGRRSKGNSTDPEEKFPPLFERMRIPSIGPPEEYLLKENIIPDWFSIEFGSRPHTNFIDNNEYPWRPIWPRAHIRFAPYFELANRIACLSRLIIKYPQHSEHLYRWMDRYIPMAIYMETMNKYDYDFEYLRQGLFWPNPNNVADRNCLPDITYHVFHSPHWDLENETDFSHSADRVLVYILKKADCAPCRYRSYGNIIRKCLKKKYGRFLYDALARIIMVSIMGSLEQTSIRGNFRLRYHMYEWYIFSGSNYSILINWVINNSMLLTYCLREHVFATAAKIPPFEDCMNQRQRWQSMRRNTLNAMDDVRARINESLSKRELRVMQTRFNLKFYKDVKLVHEFSLTDYNEQNLQISPRPMTDNLNEKIRKSFASIDKYYGELSNPPTSEEIEALADIDKIVRKFEPFQNFPYERLYNYFGVSFEAIIDLKNGEEAYILEIDRSRIKKALITIRQRNERDYRLLRHYFEVFQSVSGVIFSDLPYNITEQQIRTLSLQYGINPGEKLPEAAGSFFICMNCTFFKAKVLFDESRRGKEVRIPIYDVETKKVYCQRIVPRHQVSNKNKFKHDEQANKRLIKKKNDEFFCKYNELLSVNMIGRIVWAREQKASVFMCPGCARLCTYGRHAFKNGHLNCGCIAKKEKEDFDKSLFFSSLSSYQHHPKTFACVICKHYKKHVKWLTVANDLNDPINIETLSFCDKHFPRWTKRAHQIEQLSKIKQMLEESAFTMAMLDEDGIEIDRIAISKQKQKQK